VFRAQTREVADRGVRARRPHGARRPDGPR
jgi:hypothetical protein